MEELVALIARHEVVVALRHIASVSLDRDLAVRPVHGLTHEERPQAAAIQLHRRGDGDARGVENRGQHVDVRGDAIRGVAGLEVAGPVDEERGAHAALVDVSLPALETSHVPVPVGTVVHHEEDDGVVGQLQGGEAGEEPPDVLVDVRDHREDAPPSIEVCLGGQGVTRSWGKRSLDRSSF